MKVLEDFNDYINYSEVKRGIARVVPNHASVSMRGEDGRRVMEAVAREFVVYQWEGRDKVPYDDKYDLFFWCGCNGSERDLSYFTLSTNDRQSPETRHATYDRLRSFLASVDSGMAEVRFSYASELDEDAVKMEGMRTLAQIPQGSFVRWHGMRGRVKWSQTHGYYFMKAGARKNGYLLDWRKICDIEREGAAK